MNRSIYMEFRRLAAAWQVLWVELWKSLGLSTYEARQVVKRWYRYWS